MEEKVNPRNRPTKAFSTNIDKCAKEIYYKKDSLFNKWYWKNWTSICKNKNNIDTYLRPAATKSKFKWIINLNVKHKTSGNIEENLCDLGFGDKFLYAI